MKKVIGAATATIFGLGAFTSTATAETIVTADVLNVREKPTTESKVVEKVKNGQELKVINTEDGWSKIELNGKEVFVSSEFTKDVYHVTANLLNVRTEANTDSEILGRLKKDDVIESTHQVKDGWLQFEYKGKTAYANVSFLSSTAPTEKKTEEKTKQVAKVQKSVKEKKEVKTQKVAKTKVQEIVKPKEEAKIKEEVKVKEEAKVQEIVKPKEEAKIKEEVKVKEEAKVQEIVKPKEEAKVKEEVKVKEEPKAQEIVKPKEEAKVKEEVKEEEKAQEIVKAKEEEKAQEIAKAKEEEKAQEIVKAKEEEKAQEIVKAKEEEKAREIAKAKEEERVREIAKAKEEEKAREIAKAKEEEKAREIAKVKEEERAKEVSKNNIQSAKRELTVVATAYTADPSENGTYGGRVLTAMGHDLTANPNMRIIAVDPKVIPLGSKVWVEGYGEAIAGDTGSAIKGNRIDVLMGSKSKAMNWGRQTVKVKIL
ncbi:cell wall-binding protein EntB [Bacillus cereus]|uniref:cell wall-binding protein EntB n=3 Tax=Bacillus cereus TaxID=1396 RepID=UPI00254D342A|nr:cell wall-binding protein EntB [Bacillus cereus]MCU5671294.1 cell wall-binding protein EntB [Bacillus cereus]MDK7478591.1 cell wall-binding protein EntB [Bacillus cereus]HDR4713241.1 SH3 domain-containing protein [Bacillus cereus]HDR4718638.1 SH3 domain-containing protein [Bacillus cereus]HDR4922514.1 SH3 domain-containing protein [Bacillus cereus]